MSKFTVEPGRCLYRDGVPFVIIGRCDHTEPVEADAFTRKVCNILNEHEGLKRHSRKINSFRKFARKSAAFALIIRAVHERGDIQRVALDELKRRGLYLSDEQRKEAGLIK